MIVNTRTAKSMLCAYDPGVMHCKADSCMGWRWTSKEKKEGYCGLAGKPVELEVAVKSLLPWTAHIPHCKTHEFGACDCGLLAAIGGIAKA